MVFVFIALNAKPVPLSNAVKAGGKHTSLDCTASLVRKEKKLVSSLQFSF